MKKTARILSAVFAAVLAAASLSATTIVMPDDDQLVTKSPLIVIGTVVQSQPVERDGAIWTETTLNVEKALKGNDPGLLVIREVGGILGDRITRVYGAPVYAPGERVMVFLTPTPRGDYQTVDLFVGKFSEARTLSGEKLWVRNAVDDVSLYDTRLKPLTSAATERDANGFEAFVGARVAGRPATRNYEVEHPVLDRAAASSAQRDANTNLAIAGNFTLIDEPNIYRWTTFDNGGTANWVSYGSQNGYSGGGVNELKTAMQAWTSYTNAKIKYAYAGASTAAPGGLSTRNNLNEVMFEDPKSEIAGSWNSSTGGVVGQGGFNGVAYAPNWTSPFAADSSHPAGTFTSYAITEANLTIQDGVSPTAGLSSSRLAEIIAHEFGHTLGFGHSSENPSESNTTLSGALMYYRVSGLGATLRADDQVAARWLYPNGSQTGGGNPPPTQTVPAAPTGLTGTVSGTTATLRWTDNATDETGQAIYMAQGSAGFAKIATLAAGQTSVNVTGLSYGTFKFYVVATNAAGESAASNTVTLTVAQPVTASFSVAPSLTGTVGSTFTFYDESSGTVTTRTWQFGDGSTSSAAIATHAYASAGTYQVILTVGNNNGSSQVSKSIVVTSPQAPLAANFSFTPASPKTTDDIAFTDQSTGGVTQWNWSFGDGTSSSQQNPVKRYNAAGTYQVTLTAYRNSTSSVATKSITVTAPSPASNPVVAAFNFAPSTPVALTTVAFTDMSSGSPTRWNWSFGDGITSTEKNPSHVYTSAGVYVVSLVASNDTSSSSAIQQVTVGTDAIPYRSLLSVTAQTSGVGGSNWRTELTLFNAGTSAATVDIDYIPGAGGAVQTRTVVLQSKQASTYSNALLDLFALSSGAGALGIRASSTGSVADLRVASRTFTGSALGTYGQAVPEVGDSDLGTTRYLTGLDASSSFRTNIGIVNNGSTGATVALTLFASNGSVIGTANVTAAANNFQQTSLATLFPVLAANPQSGMTLRSVASAAGSVSVYASVVDNRTQDPIYLQGAAPATGSSLVLPAVGRAPGANGTFWRSDVAIHNPQSQALAITARYIAASSDGRNGATTTISVAPNTTATMADVLSSFGLLSGSGALELSWSGAAGPVVTSRTYTSTESGGTYGQSIDPVTRFGTNVFVPGLRYDGSFRSNVGLVNGSTSASGVSLSLLNASGSVVSSAYVELAPKSQVQYSLTNLFQSAPMGTYTLRAESTSVFAYGSFIDNTSGDPVFFAGR